MWLRYVWVGHIVWGRWKILMFRNKAHSGASIYSVMYVIQGV